MKKKETNFNNFILWNVVIYPAMIEIVDVSKITNLFVILMHISFSIPDAYFILDITENEIFFLFSTAWISKNAKGKKSLLRPQEPKVKIYVQVKDTPIISYPIVTGKKFAISFDVYMKFEWAILWERVPKNWIEKKRWVMYQLKSLFATVFEKPKFD